MFTENWQNPDQGIRLTFLMAKLNRFRKWFSNNWMEPYYQMSANRKV